MILEKKTSKTNQIVNIIYKNEFIDIRLWFSFYMQEFYDE